ncbi:MAG TPA: hypothetical protein VKR62_06825 [Roseiarcus sp.]|nr:hypothetical protein [Roseiarcus sp.]
MRGMRDARGETIACGQPVTAAPRLRGAGPWTQLAITSMPLAATGRFDNVSGADILVWNGDTLDILSSGSAPPVRQSRQDMR